MYTLIVKKLLPPILSASILLFLVALPADAGIYMQIDGLPGNSRVAGHEDWIEILSVSESISRPAPSAGSTRRRASAVFEDIGVSKNLDLTSPKLREALAQGRVYPRVFIELTATCSGGPEQTYFTYQLTNAQLTSVSLKGMSGGDRPTEELTLNFEEIKWTYQIFNNDCSEGGKVEATWNVGTGSP